MKTVNVEFSVSKEVVASLTKVDSSSTRKMTSKKIHDKARLIL